MNKTMRRIITYIICIGVICSLSVVSFAETLPAPTWISVVSNDGGTETIVIATPDYMLNNIDYYEYSFDGGTTWNKLLDVSGTELTISQTVEFAVRYTKSNVTSETYTITVAVSNVTTVTSSSTGITLLIADSSSMPKDVTLAAYEIVDGSYYTTLAEELTSNRPFTMFNVKIMYNNKEYSSDEEKSWLFPIGDFDADYAVLYYISDEGSIIKLDSTTELNALYCTTSYTGIFAVVEDKSYSPGDINGDAAVTVADARIALRTAAQLETVSDIQLSAGDVDNDGTISISDARKILQVAAKLASFD